VMLDLKRDKYLAVTSPETLSAWVAGWPVAANHAPDGSADRPATAPALLSTLIRDGLLTTNPDRGKPAQPATMPKPSSALVEFEFGRHPRASIVRAIAVGRAWRKARSAFGRLPMQRLVERVQERKARASVRSWDVQAAQDLVRQFLWLRSLYYSSRDACLFDSLVLLELLSRNEIFPTWVFGVQAAPFAAHCWIQDHGVVWNDTPEHAATFTPVLCV
jgi:transglutaminase superfamily protein